MLELVKSAYLLSLPLKLAFKDQVHVSVCDVAFAQRCNYFGPSLAVSAIDHARAHLQPSLDVDTAQCDDLHSRHSVHTRDGWEDASCGQQGAAPVALPRTESWWEIQSWYT